ncbi:uncharacterized protein LOC125657780 isoform X6 [Ostrea edulis]|uniref:uncharacterized protein LOC125657780 isoform X6 n=1 Tax=Ostrea edulis TaxID=37623 RepID=UPI0024AED53A|nr:uncharacterized protein LOC125657780 isoform X6 [Ostrea edulis]
MMDSQRSSDFQATERIFRKVIHPGLDSLRLVDKNGIPINAPLNSMKQKMFILSPRGVPTRVTNHAYSGQPMRMSRPYSEGLSRIEMPDYYNENTYESSSYGTPQSITPYSSKRNTSNFTRGNRPMVKSKSASSRGYLSSVADEKRYLQSAKSTQSSQWNSSSQGLRLEKEWTDLANSRSLKRNSEIVTHRVDRMYFMTGNSINIKPKYQVDEDELNHLRELSKSRQSSRRQSRVIHMPACNSRNSKKGQQSQLEEDLKALSVKEGNGNTDKNENNGLENSIENDETKRQKSPLAGWSLTENPAAEPDPDQKETLSRLSLHKDPEGKPPTEEAHSVRDNADQMTNDEDDGFHEDMEMKGRADGRQEVEDVLDPDPESVSPRDTADNEVEEEQ